MVEELSDSATHIRDLVDRYCRQEIHPQAGVFCVDGMYHFSKLKSSPSSSLPGCYVIYGEDKKIRYIGESEVVSGRVLTHFAPRIKKSSFWSDGSPACYIDIIPVNKPWQRFSLEQYLYHELGYAEGIRASWLHGYPPHDPSV